jgi:hypothetical protein
MAKNFEKLIFGGLHEKHGPNMEGQFPVFTSPRNRVARLYPRALGSLYVASYDSPLTTCRATVEVFQLSPNLEGQVPVLIYPRNRVVQLYPRALGFSVIRKQMSFI